VNVKLCTFLTQTLELGDKYSQTVGVLGGSSPGLFWVHNSIEAKDHKKEERRSNPDLLNSGMFINQCAAR
jgi:hypothetical protein